MDLNISDNTLWAIALAMIILTATPAGIGSSSAELSTEYSIDITGSMDVPAQTVETEWGEPTITQIGKEETGETLEVSTDVPEDESYAIRILETVDGDRRNLKSEFVEGDVERSFFLDRYDPGTYIVALTQDGGDTAVAFEQFVVKGYAVDQSVSDVTKGDILNVDIQLTEVSNRAGNPQAVNVTLHGNNVTRSTKATKTSKNSYEANFPTNELSTGSYNVYAGVETNGTVFGDSELIGLSDSRSITIGSNERHPQTDIDTSDLPGDGTSTDPYKISNASELQAMEDDLDASYELVSDIDASQTAQWNDGSGFDPIGGVSFNSSTPQPFNGSLNGNNKTLSGLVVSRQSESYSGLIGSATTYTIIRYVNLKNTTVTGSQYVGGLVGKIERETSTTETIGRIDQNTLFTGDISGDKYVGGLVGSADIGTTIQDTVVSGRVSGKERVGGIIGSSNILIRNATATGTVSGGSYVGGLAGISTGSINNATAAGSVSGRSSLGGLVGENIQGGEIRDSWAEAEVTGSTTSLIGGLVGLHAGDIVNSFAVGSVNTDEYQGPDNVGGLLGKSFDPFDQNTVKNSYWDEEATGQPTSAGSATPLTTTEMQGLAAESNMSRFDFDTTWTTTSEYPALRALSETDEGSGGGGGDDPIQVDVDPSDLPGDGTESNPYEISNASELQAMEDDLSANYELVSDIDASSTAQFNNRSGFDPVGPSFSGSLDGDGHTITGLTIDRPDETGVGLFRVAGNGATLADLTLANTTVTGNADVGGLVGDNRGSIQTATVSGSVNGTRRVGGVIGYNSDDGTVQTATVSGSVTGSDDVGGVIGFNGDGGRVHNATVSGSVSGDETVGGLVGNNRGTIQTATVSGSVNGTRRVGGLIGYNDYGGTAQNTTVAGNVTGTETVGGVIGFNDAIIIETAASGSVTGSDDVGGVIGFNGGGGRVHNATASVSVTGRRIVGGLIGDNRGTVITARTAGDATGERRVGGLIGYNDNNGTVQTATVSGNVTGNETIGGVVGFNSDDGTVQTATVSGSVSGDETVGGAVGFNSGLIQTVRVTGNVTGDNFVGGLVGDNRGTIRDTFAVGGLVAYNDGIVKQSYFDEQTTRLGTSAGNATGLTTAQMQGQAARTNLSGLDFDTTWTTTSEYPALRALSEVGEGSGSGGDPIQVSVFQRSVFPLRPTDNGELAGGTTTQFGTTIPNPEFAFRINNTAVDTALAGSDNVLPFSKQSLYVYNKDATIRTTLTPGSTNLGSFTVDQDVQKVAVRVREGGQVPSSIDGLGEFLTSSPESDAQLRGTIGSNDISRDFNDNPTFNFNLSDEESGQYFLAIAQIDNSSTDNKPGLEPGNDPGNITAASNVTFIGVDQFLLRDAPSEVQAASVVAPGETVPVSVDASNLSSPTVSHTVAIMDEPTLSNQRSVVNLADQVDQDTASVASSIETVDGVTNIDPDTTLAGSTVGENRFLGTRDIDSGFSPLVGEGSINSLVSLLVGNRGNVTPIEGRESVSLFASVTGTVGDQRDTLEVQTTDNFSPGQYSLLHFATAQNGTTTLSTKDTIQIVDGTQLNITAEPHNITVGETVTVTVTNTETGDPVANANITYGGNTQSGTGVFTTNASGQAVFAPRTSGTTTVDKQPIDGQPFITETVDLRVETQSENNSQRVDIDPSDLPGDGTESDPYEISNASELQAMEDNLDASYELVSDVDASNTAQWNDGRGFDPIGERFDDPFGPFFGSFDGNNHTITGLTINRPDESQVGLFGRSFGALRNITLADMTVVGDTDVGGLVGFTPTGSIQNARVSGRVDATGNRVGGIVGNNDGEIQTATASVSVSGAGVEAGGLAGRNRGSIQNATASGNVTAFGAVGGLVGQNLGIIRKTFAAGSVTGDSRVGGLVGENQNTVEQSYFDEQATGRSTPAGSATGLTTTQMQGGDAIDNLDGLDFQQTWKTTNEYPALRAFSDPPEAALTDFSIAGQGSEAEIVEGTDAPVSIDVTSAGDTTQTFTVTAEVENGTLTQELSVTVPAGTTQEATFDRLNTSVLDGREDPLTVTVSTPTDSVTGNLTVLTPRQADLEVSRQATNSSTIDPDVDTVDTSSDTFDVARTDSAIVVESVSANVNSTIVVTNETDGSALRVAGTTAPQPATELDGTNQFNISLDTTTEFPGTHVVHVIPTPETPSVSQGDIVESTAVENAITTQSTPLFQGFVDIQNQSVTGSTDTVTVNQSNLQSETASEYVIVLHNQSATDGLVGPAFGSSRVLTGSESNVTITLDDEAQIDSTQNVIAMLHFPSNTGAFATAIPNADVTEGFARGNIADQATVTISQPPEPEAELANLSIAGEGAEAEIVEGTDANVSVDVTNIGDTPENLTVTAEVGNGTPTQSLSVTVPAGTTEQLVFEKLATSALSADASPSPSTVTLSTANDSVTGSLSIVDPAQAVLSVQPSTTSVQPNGSFTVEMVVNQNQTQTQTQSPQPVFGAQTSLAYNTSVLNAVNVTKGTFLSADGVPTTVQVAELNETAGVVNYGEVRQTTTEGGISGSGVLFTVTFEPTQSVSRGTQSQLTLEDVILSTATGESIPIQPANATATIPLNQPPSVNATLQTAVHNVNAPVVVNATASDAETTVETVTLRNRNPANQTQPQAQQQCQTPSSSCEVELTTTPTESSWNGTGYEQLIYTIAASDTDNLTGTDTVATPIYIPGDANGDGIVNIFDSVAVGSSWKAQRGQQSYSDAGDLNNDGIINIFDSVAIGSNWQTQASVSVEPTTTTGDLSQQETGTVDAIDVDTATATATATNTDATLSVEPQTTTLQFQPESASTESFTVEVVATVNDSSQSVFGTQASLEYDTSVLNVTAVNSGSFLSADGVSTGVQAAEANETSGVVNYAETRQTTTEGGISGSGTLFTVTFEPTQTATATATQPTVSRLNLTDVILSTSGGDPVSVQLQNGAASNRELVIQPPSQIVRGEPFAVEVFNSAGEPVSGAPVTLIPGQTSGSVNGNQTATTNASGVAMFTLPADTETEVVELAASSDGLTTYAGGAQRTVVGIRDPGDLQVENLSVNSPEVTVGNSVTVSAEITNTNQTDLNQTLTITANNTGTLLTRTVTIPGNTTQQFSLTPTFSTIDTQTLSVNGQSAGTVTVTEITPPTPELETPQLTLSSNGTDTSSSVDLPAEVNATRDANLTVPLTNRGDEPGEFTLNLTVADGNGDILPPRTRTRTLEVNATQTQTVTFEDVTGGLSAQPTSYAVTVTAITTTTATPESSRNTSVTTNLSIAPSDANNDDVSVDDDESLQITDTRSPARVSDGDRFTVSARIGNFGTNVTTDELSFAVDTDRDGNFSDETTRTQTQTLPANETARVAFQATASSDSDSGSGQPPLTFRLSTDADTVTGNLSVISSEFTTAVSTGDPHIVSFDGVAYDFQAAGEFVLAREPTPNGTGSLIVQARQEPLAGSDSITRNTAVATVVNNTTVIIDATDPTPLQINGSAVELNRSDTIAVGNGTGEITRTQDGNTLTITYPGPDDTAGIGDERLTVDLYDDRVDIAVSLDPDRDRPVEGIFGPADGNATNDIGLPNGTALAQPPQAEQLYGVFRQSWQVNNSTTLFAYEDDNGPESYYDPTIPAEAVSLADLDPTTRQAAEQRAVDAGLQPGTVAFRNAVLDVALTGDGSYLTSAQQQNTTAETTTVVGAPTESTVRVEPVSASLGPGGTTNLSLILEQAPEGLAGYNLTASVTVTASGVDSTGVRVVGATAPDIFNSSVTETTIGPDNQTVEIRATDINTVVESNATDISLGTITVAANETADVSEVPVTVSVSRIDDDSGSPIDVQTQNGTVTVTEQPPLAEGLNPPTDQDNDGVFEDLNGNGRVDFNDVVILFENLPDAETPFQDVNGNGRIDFDDIVELFKEI